MGAAVGGRYGGPGFPLLTWQPAGPRKRTGFTLAAFQGRRRTSGLSKAASAHSPRAFRSLLSARAELRHEG